MAKMTRKKAVLIGVIAAMVVLVLSGVVALINHIVTTSENDDAEAVVQSYIEALMDGDVDGVLDCMPQFAKNAMLDYTDGRQATDDEVRTRFEEVSQNPMKLFASLKEQATFSFNIGDVIEATEEELTLVRAEWEEYMPDGDRIDQLKYVNVIMHVDGVDEDTAIPIGCCRMGDTWYVLAA